MITLEEYIKLNSKNDLSREDKEKIAEYNKALCEKYPWLIPTNRWSGKKITDCAAGEKGYWPGDKNRIPKYNYEYTELDNMPYGWRLRFGEEMCEEIQKELEKFNYVDKYQIVQIKEKYGTLRWYDNGHPIGKMSEEYEIVKTDDYNELIHGKDDYYQYIGKDDDENYTMMYKHYKILEKCKIGEIIGKYERLSEKVCIDCGKDAKWVSTGWISPYCDECKTGMDVYFEKVEDYFDEEDFDE